MKLYLDDRRQAPEGWIQCRWPEEVIELMKIFKVTEISLDHDLDDYEFSFQGYCSLTKERTGMDVLNWLEEQQYNDPEMPIPVIHIHSANRSKVPVMKRLARKLTDTAQQFKIKE